MKHSGTGVARAGRIVRAGAVLAIVGCAALGGSMHRSAAAQPAGRGADRQKVVQALRQLVARRQYAQARKLGYALIWRDLDQSEVMFLLGRALEGLNSKDEAATIYTLLLRTLEGKPDPRRARPAATARLKVLDVDHQRRKAKFIAAATGRKFESPKAVDDGWMLTARCDLFTPYCLGCWTLVGPRGGVPADWIHNRQGRLHRSGAKFIPAFDGRKGLLYTQSIRDKPDPKKHKGNDFHVMHLARLGGHPPHLTLTNFGGCRCLRVGVKAEERPFELRVYVGDKRVLSQRIDSSKWWDLKVDLPQPASAASRPASRPAHGGAASRATTQPARQKVVLELVSPEDQPYSGCVWIDYADFFVN